jgi:hypothetical protein
MQYIYRHDRSYPQQFDDENRIVYSITQGTRTFVIMVEVIDLKSLLKA